jgi:hypothetical protein
LWAAEAFRTDACESICELCLPARRLSPLCRLLCDCKTPRLLAPPPLLGASSDAVRPGSSGLLIRPRPQMRRGCSALIAGLASRLASSFMYSSSTPSTAAVAVSATLQATVASAARSPRIQSRQFSSKAPLPQSSQHQPMATYWRRLLHNAKAFGAQRPAAVLLGSAALGAGVWVAQVGSIPYSVAGHWLRQQGVPMGRCASCAAPSTSSPWPPPAVPAGRVAAAAASASAGSQRRGRALAAAARQQRLRPRVHRPRRGCSGRAGRQAVRHRGRCPPAGDCMAHAHSRCRRCLPA